MFVHTLPTTRAVSFADLLMSSSFAVELTQATEKRADLQRILTTIQDEKVAQEGRSRAGNGIDSGSSGGGGGGGGGGGSSSSSMRHGPSSTYTTAKIHSHAPALLTQKDWLKAVQSVDDYMTYMTSLENCLKTDEVISRAELAFSWKTSLSASPAMLKLPGIHFELLNVLIVSGKATSNLAASLVASVGEYEFTEAATLDSEGRKKKEERLRFAADLYCRAAGTFVHAANHVVRDWENDIGAVQLGQLGRSAESTREMCMALSRLAQAEAETLAIRKLLSPTTCYQTATGTAAPPLPADHPSPSLLAKLYLQCAAHFESALSLATTAASVLGSHADMTEQSANALQHGRQSGGSSGTAGFPSRLVAKLSNTSKGAYPIEEATRSAKIAPGFLKYLQKSARVGRGRAYVWLGVDKGERGEYGEAISFLRLAREQVAEISNKSAASKLHIGKAATLEHRREQKRHFAGERDAVLDLIERWNTAYAQLNDTVGFKPIPPLSSLMPQIPAGRGATTIKAFSMPSPAFGPGSVSYVSKGMEHLSGLGGPPDGRVPDRDGTRTSPAEARAGVSESSRSESYAGQGAYY